MAISFKDTDVKVLDYNDEQDTYVVQIANETINIPLTDLQNIISGNGGHEGVKHNMAAHLSLSDVDVTNSVAVAEAMVGKKFKVCR